MQESDFFFIQKVKSSDTIITYSKNKNTFLLLTTWKAKRVFCGLDEGYRSLCTVGSTLFHTGFLTAFPAVSFKLVAYKHNSVNNQE